MITVTFNALWIGLPLFILGAVGSYFSILVPISNKARQWWWFAGVVSGASLVGGIWIVSVSI